MDYLPNVMGRLWFQETYESREDAHPLGEWARRIAELRAGSPTPTKVAVTEMSGAVAAYLRLAYDLYCLSHNTSVQARLIDRLRDRHQFHGARYETKIAAIFVRAGFDVEYENEQDRTTSHCELIAISSRTKRTFSVECKRRQPDVRRSAHDVRKVGKQLVRALGKRALHPRFVFIDLDVPLSSDPSDKPAWLLEGLRQVRSFETNKVNGGHLEAAYVVLTNEPTEHFLDSRAPTAYAILEGFKIPGMKYDAQMTLEEQIRLREEHEDAEALWKSLGEHHGIPVTFDGDIPQLAYTDNTNRLRVGQLYRLDDGKIGMLRTATVLESRSIAVGVFLMDDGSEQIYECILAPEELAGWREHPETFFGAVSQERGQLSSPLELYDFFLEGYRNTPKERLLELIGPQPSFDLASMDQHELRKLYARLLTESASRIASPRNQAKS
jgi:hypothetical protein